MNRLALFISALLVAACGVNGGAATTTATDSTTSTTEGGTTTSQASTTTSTTSTTTSTTIPSVGEPRNDEYQSEGFPGTGEVAFLTDIEIATHVGYDRVVFEFDEATPEFRIRYVEPPVQESPSGQEIEVEGSSFLEIVMSPATGVDLSGEEFEETYTGPDRFQPEDAPAIQEVVRTEDFEAVMAWVLGLDSEYPFSFTTLDDPHRLVIDIHTG